MLHMGSREVALAFTGSICDITAVAGCGEGKLGIRATRIEEACARLGELASGCVGSSRLVIKARLLSLQAHHITICALLITQEQLRFGSAVCCKLLKSASVHKKSHFTQIINVEKSREGSLASRSSGYCSAGCQMTVLIMLN